MVCFDNGQHLECYSDNLHIGDASSSVPPGDMPPPHAHAAPQPGQQHTAAGSDEEGTEDTESPDAEVDEP